jgi:hypothetical protein
VDFTRTHKNVFRQAEIQDLLSRVRKKSKRLFCDTSLLTKTVNYHINISFSLPCFTPIPPNDSRSLYVHGLQTLKQSEPKSHPQISYPLEARYDSIVHEPLLSWNRLMRSNF